MNRFTPLLITMAAALVLSSLSPAFAAKTKGLDVQLISEVTQIVPGKAFTVGLHIKHHPGYHTYWKSPGVVGLATSLKWQLPSGFKASDIIWPYPEISSMAGHPCHGYERDVTLLVTITPPKVIQEKQITLKTTASWMCCAKNCYPDSKEMSLTLDVSNQVAKHPVNSKLIQKSLKNVPIIAPDCKATLLTGAQDTKIKIHIDLAKKVDPKTLYLFSSDGQISSDLPQRFIPQNDGSLILTINRSEFSPKKNTHLPAVLKAGNQYFQINPSYLSEK